MKTLLLILTITIGILFPFTHKYSFLIKYLLMTMLFFSFLQMNIKRESFDKSHLLILLLNIVIPIILYYLLREFNLDLAVVVFITAIAPTAIAAPIIVSLLGKKIEYTFVSIIITNFTIALLLPFLIPYVLNDMSSLSFFEILIPVATVFLIPFLLSQIIKRYFGRAQRFLGKLSKYVFYILVININLGTAKASNFIYQEMSFADPIIYQIGFFSLFLCLSHFYIGRWVAPRKFKVQGGQSLGQKNNGFTVWVALTFISPLAVLGPVFYILFQNIYVSAQLHRNSKNH